MAQRELFEVFVKERICGNNDFMTIKQIEKLAYDITPRIIRRAVNRLYADGFLEIRRENRWYRKYRIKLKYLKNYTNN